MSAPRIALLTGRSDPARTGLPPTQAAFLAAVTPPGAAAIRDGYPWEGGLPEGHVPLPLAAWRNAAQWRAARTCAARAMVADRLASLRGGPLAIVTGSCGSDLLACGWIAGICDLVVALGPVTRRRPPLAEARLETVIGRQDRVSRAMHRVAPDRRVPCGHMGYWTCPATRAAVADVLRALARAQ